MIEPDALDSYQIIPVIPERVKLIFGTQKACAEHLRLSESYVSDMMTGRKKPCDELLKALKIRRKAYFFCGELP